MYIHRVPILAFTEALIPVKLPLRRAQRKKKKSRSYPIRSLDVLPNLPHC